MLSLQGRGRENGEGDWPELELNRGRCMYVVCLLTSTVIGALGWGQGKIMVLLKLAKDNNFAFVNHYEVGNACTMLQLAPYNFLLSQCNFVSLVKGSS